MWPVGSGREPWDAYHDGPAPWDKSQPQPAIVRLASVGGFAGRYSMQATERFHVASLGLSVLGVDVAETALAIAREKADDRARWNPVCVVLQ